MSISFNFTEAILKQSVLKLFPKGSEIDKKSLFPFFAITNSENRRAHAKSNPGFAAQLRGPCRRPLPDQQQLPPPPTSQILIQVDSLSSWEDQFYSF